MCTVPASLMQCFGAMLDLPIACSLSFYNYPPGKIRFSSNSSKECVSERECEPFIVSESSHESRLIICYALQVDDIR